MIRIDRKEYLNFLIESKDKQIIKVVSGVRRCGKSTLFEIYKDYLIKNGVEKKQIISINFEDMDYGELTDYKKLYEYINSKMLEDKKNYIFLDEIQHVDKFEKVVDSLFIKDKDAWQAAISELRRSHVLVASPRLGLDDEQQNLLALAIEKGHGVIVPFCYASSNGNDDVIDLKSPPSYQIKEILTKAQFPDALAEEFAKIGNRRLSALMRYLVGAAAPSYAKRNPRQKAYGAQKMRKVCRVRKVQKMRMMCIVQKMRRVYGARSTQKALKV